MKKVANNKPFIVLVSTAGVLTVVLFIFAFVLNPTKGLFGNNNIEVDTETLKQNYSQLNQLKPGTSTIEDVKEVNGEPTKTEEKDGKTYMYYPTPFEKDGNIVVMKDGTVEYVFEYVFGDYRGKYSDYLEMYGQPSLELKGDTSEYKIWSVYLNEGIVAVHSNDRIDGIVYFKPQNENSFMNTVASDLGLRSFEGKPGYGGEVFSPPDSTPAP